jgi:hypothetical protein
MEICNVWKVCNDLKQALETNLLFWIAHPSSQPPTAHINNTELRTAMKEQSNIGWGLFFKGFISRKIQLLINEHRAGPLNQFEKIRWTYEVISNNWASKQDHWNHRNKDKHGHTQEEEAQIKRDKLLDKAHALFILKTQIELKYRPEIFPNWKRIKKKRTNNLEVWIDTTRQTLHYLLNVNKQADNDPTRTNNTLPPPRPSESRLKTIRPHPKLFTPVGSETSVISSYITVF